MQVILRLATDFWAEFRFSAKSFFFAERASSLGRRTSSHPDLSIISPGTKIYILKTHIAFQEVDYDEQRPGKSAV